MEYYSASKNYSDLKKILKMIEILEPWEHYAMWNKPDAKGQILHDSTYIRQWE